MKPKTTPAPAEAQESRWRKAISSPRKMLDDVVILVFAAVGLIGGIVLVLATSAPPIVIALLLAIAVASLVYGFLGGIPPGTTVAIGGVKLGGTLAALIGVTVFLNGTLLQQLQKPLTDADIVGQWKWQYAEGGWRGFLYFSEENKKLTFVGSVEQAQNGQLRPLLQLDAGTATIANRNQLQLACTVKELANNRTYHWVSAEPLHLGPFLAGQLIVPSSDPLYDGLRHYQWGIALTREAQ
jgi:hypothetical protein